MAIDTTYTLNVLLRRAAQYEPTDAAIGLATAIFQTFDATRQKSREAARVTAYPSGPHGTWSVTPMREGYDEEDEDFEPLLAWWRHLLGSPMELITADVREIPLFRPRQPLRPWETAYMASVKGPRVAARFVKDLYGPRLSLREAEHLVWRSLNDTVKMLDAEPDLFSWEAEDLHRFTSILDELA